MLVLPVGPKGSGKRHIGRTLERRLGVLFFHVEPPGLADHDECRAAGCQPVITDGIARVHPRLAEALRAHRHVCVETTGAAPEILADLLALAPAETLVVRVRAPLAQCLERIAARDPTQQIPMDEETIRKVDALSGAAAVTPALELDNVALTESEIVAALDPFLAPAPAAGVP
jgi:hypothetical protein